MGCPFRVPPFATPFRVPTYWCTLMTKTFFQCVTYLFLILNSKFRLKYIRFKIGIQRDLSFHGMFAFPFSRSVYKDDFFVNLTNPFVHCYLNMRLIYHLTNSLFWLGLFLRSLRNVFSRTERRPVREKQIGWRD